MQYCVFIHTNHKQWIGALVAQYALRRNSENNDKFDVRFIHLKDYPFFQAREDQLYLRHGVKRRWINDDLQSFTPLRFMPPELMGFAGRAVVIDPDIFAVGDIWELLSRDMQGKAIMCRARSGTKGLIDRCLASSVMLLDCAKLTHWHCAEHDFDKLTEKTKLLHNTKRRTQPWKTGLPTDWRPAEKYRFFPPLRWAAQARRHFFGEYAFLGRYVRHPDLNQERFFFGLLRECLEKGIITAELLRQEMRLNHVRHDAFEVMERTPPLAPPPNSIDLSAA